MSPEVLFALGCGGSAFDELLHWGALRRSAKFPTYARSPVYWVITALLIVGGGAVTYLLGISTTHSFSPLAAFVVGFSAPALVKKLSKIFLGTPGLGTGTAKASVVGFLNE